MKRLPTTSYAPALSWTATATRARPRLLRQPWRQPPCATAASFSTTQSRRQAHPRGSYYDVLLTDPPPYSHGRSNAAPTTAKAQSVSPAEAASKAAETPEPPATTARKEVEERARVVFGSRLAGPVEREKRLAEVRQRSQRIAGVLVPPKPEEPDNCCMSGCVNCVWDLFRDEMEEWAAASAEATRRLKAQEGGVAASTGAAAATAPFASAPRLNESSVSMDDDGGGSSSNWSAEDVGSGGRWNEDLYKNVPVGIREFMKQEKRLKLKHMQEGTVGG